VGQYTVAGILPGHYSVTAKKQGFRLITVQSFVLQVDQTAKVDLVLLGPHGYELGSRFWQ
jgi:2-phospho-L-lactate guanylyltransferase (CobY/MobA/RfbA family)